MNLAMLLEMAGEVGDDRLAVGRLSYPGLLDRARRASVWLAARPGVNVGLVDVNSEAGPVALFGAAIAGRPFAPMNYRWSDDQLQSTFHRVKNPGPHEYQGARYSLAFFCQANRDAVVEGPPVFLARIEETGHDEGRPA